MERLCSSRYPDFALVLFRKDTPWTRGYVTQPVEAWNASGGMSSSIKLAQFEEVLVLRQRSASSGGIVVSGSSGSFDALRWDGHCVSLESHEVTLKPPSAMTAHASIPWKFLDEKTRDALIEEPKIKAAVERRIKDCKGAALGDVSPQCVRAESALSAVIVNYVRQGGRVPPPHDGL